MNIKDISNIKDLIQLMGESDVNELSLEDKDVKLTLKRGATVQEVVTHVAAPQAIAAPAAAPAAAAPAADAAPAEDPSLHYVTAPLVGTFYSSPAPDAPPYNHVGDKVKKGQVLCIIEAMKLMNEIESDADGTIVEIMVDNASPVDYGAKIFSIKPN